MTISPSSRHRMYRLAIPATAEFVATARLFVAGVAAIAVEDEDITDDLKLAVSELVSAIVAHGVGGEVMVAATVSDHHVTLDVTPWPDDMEHQDFGPLDIVETLFPGTASLDGAVRVPVDLAVR